MKKIGLLMLVCMLLVGCGEKKASSVVDNKAFEKEDILMTSTEATTTEEVDSTLSPVEETTTAVETEPEFDTVAFKAELVDRIYDVYYYTMPQERNDKTKESIVKLCDENLNGAIAWYYDFLTLQDATSTDDQNRCNTLATAIRYVREGTNTSQLNYYSECLEYVKEDISMLDKYEADYKERFDIAMAAVKTREESKAVAESSAEVVVEAEGLKVTWEEPVYTMDGLTFNGSETSSAWYGVEVQKGMGNDDKIYLRGLFNNKNDESKHLYVEWDYSNGQTYSAEVSVSTIEECSSYYNR